MQNWTTEMWQAAGIGLVIGLILGYLFLRFTKDSVKKQLKTETELQKVKNQLDSQKQQLEKHFSESAELLKNIAQDYQKLYKHVANSSSTLLPELSNNPLFSSNLIGAEPIDKTNPSNKDEQPRDYSEGSSGLFKNDN
ncbi:YhcB family protein [Bisgaard Taxon 45]|uniref:Z-ring associated protein G n=1 Tax=Bisgaard Taxon 45 TaxID=304289 RepID=A0ABT9KIV1_9PAST|nr:YhcB family protein [Bisgaard Taxon 45]